MRKLSSITLVILGIFFVVDSLLWHTITFDYSFFGLGFLDPVFSPLYLGLILISVAVVSWRYE